MSTTSDEMERLQAEVARLASKLDGATTTPLPHPPRNTSSYVLEIGRKQEAARQARIQASRMAAEAAERQAERDAPKQAKRDAELKVLDDKICELTAAITGTHDQIRELGAKRIRLVNRPL